MMAGGSEDLEMSDRNYNLIEKKISMDEREFQNQYLNKEEKGFSLMIDTNDPSKFREINFDEFRDYLDE